MFLDEKLEKIHSELGSTKECAKELLTTCFESIDNDGNNNTNEYLNSLKRIDYTWKLFCKKHKEYKSDGFRNFVIRCAEDKADIYKKVLGW